MISKIACKACLICIFILTLVSTTWAQPARPASCSDATLNGNSGFLVSGSDGNGPVIAGGQITADGKGGFTGTESISENGTVTANLPVKGTYTVRTNCTGKGQIAPKGGSATHFNFTIVSSGTTVQLVVLDSGTVESGLALAQGAATCSTEGVQGTYGFQSSGILVGTGSLVFGGRVNVHQGVISGTTSGSFGGQIFTGGKLAGTIKVDKNCTGKAVVSVNQEPPLHLDVVVVNGGDQLGLTSTDSGTVVSGSMTR